MPEPLHNGVLYYDAYEEMQGWFEIGFNRPELELMGWEQIEVVGQKQPFFFPPEGWAFEYVEPREPGTPPRWHQKLDLEERAAIIADRRRRQVPLTLIQGG
jgi:hypothetical protein